MSRIPLNDDKKEKAARLQSRQALHDLQLNSLKAAASPMRKASSSEQLSGSPRTPRNDQGRGDVGAPGLSVVGGSALTPMKRVPILANFEEWMKMATDNKINATNSWNFALIDYFHDMSLLKEGDGVNFQKASCTLDGCVKIYTSRVDSVATETGKLLSGLAESRDKRGKKGHEDSGDGDNDGEDEEEEGEDGVKKRVKKRAQRSSEATLATSFAALQLKKMELEFSVDPLFKKASADFDEGGAKGLLLNHLAIDSQGRIVFDSSDDAEAAEAGDHATEEDVERGSEPAMEAEEERGTINLGQLGSRFFPDLSILDSQGICPSMKKFDLSDTGGLFDIQNLKNPEEQRPETRTDPSVAFGDASGIVLDDDNAVGFDADDDDGILAGFDIPADTGFGEGGEAWAKDVAVEQRLQAYGEGFDVGVNGADEGPADGEVADFDASGRQHTVSLVHEKYQGGHEDILSYFDNAMRKNWAGPEHWKIRRMKAAAKAPPAGPKRKKKEPFKIDFDSPLDPALAELIYTPATSNSAITLPKSQWKHKTRNLLPDDKHFNSKNLIRLFLKPKARIGTRQSNSSTGLRSGGVRDQDIPTGEVDEAFWARQDKLTAQVDANADPAQAGNYDADFFQDDGLPLNGGIGGRGDEDDEEFADAREMFSPESEERERREPGAIDPVTGAADTQGFGAQLVTQSKRLRPEYVQYARVAKKVDVRRLKEEMWKGIGFPEDSPLNAAEDGVTPAPPPSSSSSASTAVSVERELDQGKELKFTSVMNDLQKVYPAQAMADISTSYCFICLLHLANEKGLTLENEVGLEELSIRRDNTAVLV